MPQPMKIIAFIPQPKKALLGSVPEPIETIGSKNRDQLRDKQVEVQILVKRCGSISSLQIFPI
jgi:hypothetical protein